MLSSNHGFSGDSEATSTLISLQTAIPATGYFLILEYLPDVQTLKYPSLSLTRFLGYNILNLKKTTTTTTTFFFLSKQPLMEYQKDPGYKLSTNNS